MKISTSQGKYEILWIASIEVTSVAVSTNTHKEKSKILKYNTENTSSIILDGKALEEVESFMYLSSIIDKQGGSNANMNAWVGKTRASIYKQLSWHDAPNLPVRHHHQQPTVAEDKSTPN